MKSKFIWFNLIYIVFFSICVFAAEENKHEPWVENALKLADAPKCKYYCLKWGESPIFMIKDSKGKPAYVFKRWTNALVGEDNIAVREKVIYEFCRKYPLLKSMVPPYAYVENVKIYNEIRAFTGIERFLPAYTDPAQLEKLEENLRESIISSKSVYGSITFKDIKKAHQAAIINNIDPLNYYTLLVGSILLNLKDATLRNILCYLKEDGKIGLCFIDTGDSLDREAIVGLGMLKPQLMFIGDLATKPFPKEIVDLIISLIFEELKQTFLNLAPLNHYQCRTRERDEVIDILKSKLDEDYRNNRGNNCLLKRRNKIIRLSNIELGDTFDNLKDRLAMFKDNLDDMAKIPVAEFICKYSTGEFRRELFKCYESGTTGYLQNAYGFNAYREIRADLTCADFWDKMYRKYKDR